MMLSQLIQQRDRTIYIIAAITSMAYMAWRRLPQGGNWIFVRRGLLAWLISVEWILILVR